jgi:hypothetical protein
VEGPWGGAGDEVGGYGCDWPSHGWSAGLRDKSLDWMRGALVFYVEYGGYW